MNNYLNNSTTTTLAVVVVVVVVVIVVVVVVKQSAPLNAEPLQAATCATTYTTILQTAQYIIL